MKTSEASYNFPPVGCYVDTSAQSADDCNLNTIEFAQGYGFKFDGFYGCLDGLRGTELLLPLDCITDCAHQGKCDDDVSYWVKQPEIATQLDKIGADKILAALKECGGWSESELADDSENRNRALWIAAGSAKDELSQSLSDEADKAVDYLNSIETRSHMYWGHEDNSLFLMANVEAAQEDCEFVSSKEQEYPADDYQGEWLHVSDHGNATLYVRTNGQDKEIWAVV